MYAVDDRDVVIQIPHIPRPSAGAPEPVIFAEEGSAVVAYYGSGNIDWNTATAESLGDDEVVVLRFESVRSLMLGSPNDEALQGHPLFGRGLDFYSVHSVDNSSWIRRLELMNRVHPQHDPARFSRLRHFIVTFHDSTFECVCGSDPLVAVVRGTTPQRAVAEQA